MESIGFVGVGNMARNWSGKFGEYKCFGIDPNIKKEDRPENIEFIEKEKLKNMDTIIFSIPMGNYQKIVDQYIPYIDKKTKIISQCSVKSIEGDFLKKSFPKNPITLAHSLHGPGIPTDGKNLILIGSSDSNELLAKLNSKNHHSSVKEHDQKTAETQVLTHTMLLAVGNTMEQNKIFPWDSPIKKNNLDSIKLNLMLRMLIGNKDVYTNLAMLNPYAKEIVGKYTNSVKKVFSLLTEHNIGELEKIVNHNFNLKTVNSMENYDLRPQKKSSSIPNSHLSLLGLLHYWKNNKSSPNQINDTFGTPLYGSLLKLCGTLQSNKELLESSLNSYSNDITVREDRAFIESLNGYKEIIENKDKKRYENRFDKIDYFFEKYKKKGNDLCVDFLKNN
jgi:prephenate dehydrogenase